MQAQKKKCQLTEMQPLHKLLLLLFYLVHLWHPRNTHHHSSRCTQLSLKCPLWAQLIFSTLHTKTRAHKNTSTLYIAHEKTPALCILRTWFRISLLQPQLIVSPCQNHCEARPTQEMDVPLSPLVEPTLVRRLHKTRLSPAPSLSNSPVSWRV